MNPHDKGVVHSSAKTGGKDDWQTPLVILDAVRSLNPSGRIDYDPCGGKGDLVHAVQTTRPPEDGLLTDWTHRGLVFVNPPYSQMAKWAAKAMINGLLMKDLMPGETPDQIIALVAARTDTRWWSASARHAQAICFWRGRVKFIDPQGVKGWAAPFPSALLYWGPHVGCFIGAFEKYGMVVEP